MQSLGTEAWLLPLIYMLFTKQRRAGAMGTGLLKTLWLLLR